MLYKINKRMANMISIDLQKKLNRKITKQDIISYINEQFGLKDKISKLRVF